MHSPLDGPAATVASLADGARLVIVTGPRGGGKTTWCHALVDEARARGYAVAGVLSPHVIADGARVAIDLTTVGGERRRLAVPRHRAPNHSSCWLFNEATLAWGNDVLRHSPPADVLVIDELGPLEFEQHAGLTAGLALVDAHHHRLTCVVVRPRLLSLALLRWPSAEVRWAGEPPGGPS